MTQQPQPSQIAAAILTEAQATHQDVEALHPLLALLEKEGESPLMQLVETVAIMAVTLEQVLRLVESLHRRLDRFDGSIPPSQNVQQ